MRKLFIGAAVAAGFALGAPASYAQSLDKPADPRIPSSYNIYNGYNPAILALTPRISRDISGRPVPPSTVVLGTYVSTATRFYSQPNFSYTEPPHITPSQDRAYPNRYDYHYLIGIQF